MNRKSCVAFLMSLIMCILVGCSKPEEQEIAEPISLIYVSTRSPTSKDHDVPIEDYIRDVYVSHGNSAFILIDGNPQICRDAENMPIGYMSSDTIESLKKQKEKNTDMWIKQMKRRANTVCDQFAEEQPGCDESDTLAAINEAVLAFNIMDRENDRILVIHDTGLCSIGVLSFIKTDYLSMSDEQLSIALKQMSDDGLIPDLSGVEVIWYGLGDTAGGQQPLPPQFKSRLKSIWSEIIAIGGGFVEFKDIPGYEMQSVSTSVTPIPIPLIQDDTENDNFIVSQVFFLPDEDEFLDKTVACDTLETIANEMKNNPESKWFLIGCTAGNTTLSLHSLKTYLSAERATRVQKSLVNLGVPESQLKTVSLGPYSPWQICDTEDGHLVEERAAQNRRVLILKEESDEARKHESILELGLYKV